MILHPSHAQEHRFAQIISDQAVHGWDFDYCKAKSLYGELDNRMQEIYDLVRPNLTMEIKKPLKAPVLQLRKKSGDLTKRVMDYWGNEVAMVGGMYSPIEWVEPDLGSRPRLMKQLQRHGWVPVNYTDPSESFPNGQPKLDEESLQGLDLGETGNLLIEYFKASQRRSTLANAKGGGWLNKCWAYHMDRWRIPAEANSLGTNTHRCTHRIVTNVPAADPDVYYGKEFRSLYIAPPGYEVLGMDASQLEFRIALSYMGANKMIELVKSGEDFHTLIWKDIDKYMRSRSSTKNVVYGSIYGASDLKLGQMADTIPKGMTKVQVGKAIKRALTKYMPGLDSFADLVKDKSKRGYIIGIDGFPVYMRKNENGSVQTHKAINTLYQHAGSMVVKRATVYFHDRIPPGLRGKFVQTAHVHDEIQGIVQKGYGPQFGELFRECLIEAGHSYGLSCPMEADYKIGSSWADTH